MFWSMGNETNKAVDSKYAVQEDTTRILTARRVENGSQGTYAKHSDENLALENLLRCTVRGWYNTDVKNLEPSDQQHSGTEEHQLNMLKASGRFGTGNLSTWLYEDHGADREYLNAPLLHVNPKGYVDLYRVPKYAYYFWQATYSEKPMVFILPHFWRSQYLGQKKDIVVTSNCEKVELKVNGVSKGTQTPDQANYHTVVFKDVAIENAVISATGTRNGKTVVFQLPMAGDPARIVVGTVQQKISADRASVSIIQADIVDSKGNHVYGANNTLKWTVSGPAKLAGPAVWESDINKHHEMEGSWYIDAPVSNVIRSTGEPGKIKVTVSAGGLASASLEITADPVPPDNSVIVEPELKNEGRTGTERVVLQPAKLEETPQEISKTYEGIKLSASGRAGYIKAFADYALKNNPKLDTSTVEFRALSRLFAGYLSNNGGQVIADDYNFNAEHFNTCRLITSYIIATKLPQQFKDGLREHYALSLIQQGNEKNAGDEMNWLNWIPSGGTVVYYVENMKTPAPKGTIYTNKNELQDIIAVVYPDFMKFSDDGRERAIAFIDKMNPYVNAVSMSEVIDGKKVTKTKIIAEKGKPVLIPLYKFIAE
jgi:hypothetical protein